MCISGVAPPARSKATKVAVAAEEAEAPAAEEEMPPPSSRKRKERCDVGQVRHNISKMRFHKDACIGLRQLMINGKWHDLVEVSAASFNYYCVCASMIIIVCSPRTTMLVCFLI